jgi:hypothetical protein
MIDSTYRDRYLYPNPAEFIIPINVPIGNNVFTARNPLVDGYPIHNCYFLTSSPFIGTIIGGNARAIQVDPSIDALTGLGNPLIGTTLDQANNILINLTVMIDGDTNIYRVTGYDPIRHILTLDSPVLNFTVGASYSISNPSTPSTILLQGYEVSALGTTNNQDGYFLSINTIVYVWDLTLNEIREGTLQEYSIQLSQPFSGGWAVTDQYLFSLGRNIDYGVFNPFYLKSGLWQFDISFPGVGYTNQMEIRIVTRGDTRPDHCIAIGRVTHINRGGVARLQLLYCGDQYILHGEYYIQPTGEPFREDLGRLIVSATAIGYEIQSVVGKMPQVGSYFMPMLFTPQFHLNPNDPTLLQLSPNKSIPFIPNRILKNITSMDGDTLNGVTPILDVFMHGNRQVILTQPFKDVYHRFQCSNLEEFPEALSYQILPFLRDGTVSMDYRGSTVSSNQMVCYSLTVNTLILPNQILNLPFGALTSSYPYVLLEITNETSSSGHNKSVIYSNNPNTVSATFVCSISDVNSPLITKFININSDKSSQIIKFKPNDNLKFRISMPDGRTFETEIKDYIPPLPPNPLFQINCLIETIRL